MPVMGFRLPLVLGSLGGYPAGTESKRNPDLVNLTRW